MSLEHGYALSIVTIDVWDWQGMVDFYQDALGLNAIELEPDERYGWLDAGSVVLAFRGVDEQVEQRGTGISLQFEVDDIERSIEELENSGCEFYDKQLEGEEGYRIAYFYDPEGNSLAVYHHEHEAEPHDHAGHEHGAHDHHH